MKQCLGAALEQSKGSVVGRRLMYRFATETPDLFCNAGLALLMEADNSPAVRYMTSFLLRQKDVLGILADPLRFTKTDAQTLFLHLMTFDPGLDIRLAQYVRNHDVEPQGRFNDQMAERALDILDLASQGRRIVQVLNHLVEHPNPRISSKATLVIGRRIQNVDWAERQILTPGDPRRRANAIEAIWGIDNDKARRIMIQHAHDRNNRVAGNSTYGLHVVGDVRSRNLTTRMATNTDSAFRWTAAWLMGQIGDPEFLGPLRELLEDECPGVKSASLRAMVNIRREQTRLDPFSLVPEEAPLPLDLSQPEDPFPKIRLSFNGRHMASRIDD